MPELNAYIEEVEDLGMNNKAKEITISINHDPSTIKVCLVSYETPVAYIQDGKCYELPHLESATTNRHLCEFCRKHNIDKSEIIHL